MRQVVVVKTFLRVKGIIFLAKTFAVHIRKVHSCGKRFLYGKRTRARLLEMSLVWVQMIELSALDDEYWGTPFGKHRVHNAIGNR
jgi:hypothetical protein